MRILVKNGQIESWRFMEFIMMLTCIGMNQSPEMGTPTENMNIITQLKKNKA